MDFHTFKRSEALQSPVCLLGWNSKGTSVPVARGSWTKLSSDLSSHANASIRGGLSTLLIKAGAVPRAEQGRASPALCQRQSSCCPPRETGGSCKAEGKAPPPHTEPGEQLQPGPCPWTSVSVPLGFLEKAWLWQLQLQPLSESWAVTCYKHHPQTSITLSHRKSSEMEPSKGRTTLFVSSASMYWFDRGI